MDAVMEAAPGAWFAAPAKAEVGLENRGNAKVSQPTLIASPQPIDLKQITSFPAY